MPEDQRDRDAFCVRVHNNLKGDLHNDVLDVGASDDAGNDAFVFDRNDGGNVVRDFDSAKDEFVFVGTGPWSSQSTRTWATTC